jgi:signal peptidase I
VSSSRIRSLLVSALVLALAGVGWYYFAPTQIGGSTRYVITHGISMEPLLHTGDLALVRPASDYHVGDVVAYHSTLLHTVVLHRIYAIHDGYYTFKGENNDFLDPTHPTRALLIGRMWLHIPRGGFVLNWIHKPWVAALLTGGVAMLLLFGGDQQRRRRRSRHGHTDGGSNHAAGAPSYVVNRALLIVSLVCAALFAALGVLAFTRSTSGSSSVTTQYTQQLSFGYHGPAQQGSVYPNGEVTTGDPVYLQLVHQLSVSATYAIQTPASAQTHGSIRIHGVLSNGSGWSRGFWLSPKTRFSGSHGSATAQLNLLRLQALTSRVTSQIGAGGGIYTLAITPQVTLSGTVGGAPLRTTDSAVLDLSLGAEAQLSGQSAIASSGSGAASAAGSSPSVFVHSTHGGLLSSAAAATNKLGGVPVPTVRWIAIAGFALFTLLISLTGLRELRGSEDPIEHINQRYKHLIVPVSSIIPDTEHPPIEVRTIEALAQLAERSERLILHDHQEDVDNYLIDDQGTMFRFQALRIRDTNGNGNGNRNGKHTTEPSGDVPVAVGVGAAEAAENAEGAGSSEAAAGPRAPRVAPAVDDVDTPGAPVSVMAPLNDPVESAQAIKLSDRVTPDLMVDAEPRRPPVPNYTHWSRRPEVRVGFTLAPLLTLFAWRQVRARRSESRPVELDDQPFAPPERRHGSTPPPRGPGDRRRRDRRRN